MSALDGADPRGRFFATSQYTTESAQMGDTRGFGRLWDVDNQGQMKGEVPQTGWSRGQIVRASQPVFVLTSLGPMYDVTANPASWSPGL